MKKTCLKLLLFVFLTISVISTKAQFVQTAYTENFLKGATDLISVRFSDKSFAFVTNNNDKSVDIKCTDNSYNTKWAKNFPGYLISANRLGSNLMIIVSTDYSLYTRANSEYKGFLVDPKTGALVKEQLLYKGNNEYLTFPYIILSKDHQKLTLATRESSLKRTVKFAPGMLAAMYTMKVIDNKMNTNKFFQIQTFDKDLNVKDNFLPNLTSGDFVGIAKTVNEDTYIAVSNNKSGISISKFVNANETAVKTISEPYSFYAGFLGSARLSEQVSFISDTLSNDKVYLYGSFKNDGDYTSIFNAYDFNTGDTHRFKKVFTKDELKGLEKNFTAINKDFKKVDCGSPKNVELRSVAFTPDNYYLVFDNNQFVQPAMVPGQTTGQPYFNSQSLLVCKLEKDMKVTSMIPVPNEFTHYFHTSFKTYFRGNDLYLMASYTKGGRFTSARIDTKTNKLTDMQLIEPKKTVSGDIAALSEAVITPDYIFVPMRDSKISFVKVKYDINMYQFKW